MAKETNKVLLSLARILARGEQAAIVACPWNGQGELRGPVWDSQGDKEFSVFDVPLDVLLGDPQELAAALEHPTIAGAQFVLLVPPFGRWESRPSRHDMSEIATKTMANALAAEKRLCSVLPTRTISGRGDPSLLSEIVAGRNVSAVMELPAQALMEDVHPAFRVCVVVLDVALPTRTPVLSFPANTDVESVVQEHEQLFSVGGRTTHGFALEEAIDPSQGFLPNQLDPAIERRIEEASILGALIHLGELCEVIRGLSHIHRTRKERRDGDLPVLSGRMIKDGRVTLDDESEWVEASAEPTLQAGDLVIRAIMQPGSSFHVAEVQAYDLPVVAGRYILVLRPHSRLSPAERRVLLHFIRSRRFYEQLPSQRIGSINISKQELAEIRVPFPDSDLLDAFENVESALSDFEAWRVEGTNLLESSLDSEDLADARRQLIGKSNLLRQRAAAGRLLDDLSHRVSTRFPLPVAYRWRSALAARGSPEALRTVLSAQEVLLAYLSFVALVSARVHGEEMGHVRDIRERFTKRRGGVSLGDWRAILEEAANSRMFRSLPESHPFVEVRDYFRDTEIAQASIRLSDLRNDRSHLREYGPRDSDIILEAAWSDLESLFLAAEFITEYPLIRIVETRWDSLESRNEVTYLNLAGDSPIVPREVMSVPSNTVETDSLYLIDSQHQLHLLRPLIMGTECQACGHWSTFHPERVLPNGTVEYKSLEHGHPYQMAPSAGRALAAIGFLEPASE